MSSFAGTADGTTGISCRRQGRLISRGWEITGIVLGFVFAWPLAVAYLVWKFAGYPAPEAARAFVESRWARAFAPFVEELKRAKDREEFDAFMAKRRSAGQAS